MTAKEYLLQIKDLESEIHTTLEDIQRLSDMATSITQTAKADMVQSSGSQQKMADAATAIVMKQEELSKAVSDYLQLKEQIISQIKGISDAPQRNILLHRYIEHKTFEKIAVDMDYSWRHIIRLHGTALATFGNKYSDFF